MNEWLRREVAEWQCPTHFTDRSPCREANSLLAIQTVEASSPCCQIGALAAASITQLPADHNTETLTIPATKPSYTIWRTQWTDNVAIRSADESAYEQYKRSTTNESDTRA
jgi:hypothetical protein